MHPTIKKLWVPQSAFASHEQVFILSVTDHGDMYHVRAAMHYMKISIVIFDASEKPTPFQVYLRNSALEVNQYSFEVPWSWNVLASQEKKPTNLEGILLDGQPFTNAADLKLVTLKSYGENSAAAILAHVMHGKNEIPRDLINFMTNFSNNKKTKLDEDYKSLFPTTSNSPKPDQTIRVLYIDSGAVAHGVVRRELACGDDTFKVLNDAFNEVVKNLSNIKLDIQLIRYDSNGFHVGDNDGHMPIGQNTLDGNLESTDVNAYKLRWGYDHGYIHMACGLRSGLLDLFTFLGIPTVSIGLRNMTGEDRHIYLAKKIFKRIGVQYDQPRHTATTYVLSKNGNSFELNDQGAPDLKPNPVLSSYTNFDKEVLQTGMKLACQRFIPGCPEIVSFLNIQDTYIVGTHETRYAYPEAQDVDDMREYLAKLRMLDFEDLEEQEKKVGMIYENKKKPQDGWKPEHVRDLKKYLLSEYRQRFQDDWTTLLKVVNRKVWISHHIHGKGIISKARMNQDDTPNSSAGQPPSQSEENSLERSSTAQPSAQKSVASPSASYVQRTLLRCYHGLVNRLPLPKCLDWLIERSPTPKVPRLVDEI